MNPPDSTTSRKQQVLVLIPCLNEAGRIGQVVESIRSVLPDAGVVVIDDASSDTSGDEARAAGAMVLTHVSTLGYGAALETGYQYACHRGVQAVLQMDGDGQHLAEDLPRLLEPIRDGSADLVIGSRYAGSTDRGHVPWLRRVGHRVFAGMIALTTRLKLSDPTSGFQALSHRALLLFASGVFPCDYPDSDVILMSYLSGLRIREVPVRMVERTGGQSMHAGLHPLYYGIKMLLAMFIVLLNFRRWKRWRQRFPEPDGPPNADKT